MLEHTHLLRDDVHLLADLGADLRQRVAVVGAHPLGLRQLVATDLARQRGVRWLEGRQRFAIPDTSSQTSL
jgi:hypothetical protein